MISVHRDEGDRLWHWWCRSARGYLTQDAAYEAASAAHPDTIVTIEKETKP